MATFTTPHQHLDIDGDRLAYYRFGRGPDVVMVHGWPLHAATFRRIVPALARQFTLHLFDLPGAGNSLDWRAPYSLATHPRVVRKAIDRLGLDRYALLAHDSGGAIARHVAADDPRVRGLILEGTEIPGHHPAVIEAYVRATKIPGFARLLVATMGVGVIRRSSLGFGGCFTDPSFVDGDFGDLFVKPMLGSWRVAKGQLGLIRDLDFAFLDALDTVHARIQAPVRCIWGSDDPFFPIGKARKMLAQFGGEAELVEIPGAKLFVHEDHPDTFVAHAAPFLERCLAERQGRAASA
jgi:pimeloyl-ACP methyl ester carboxylesterase